MFMICQHTRFHMVSLNCSLHTTVKPKVKQNHIWSACMVNSLLTYVGYFMDEMMNIWVGRFHPFTGHKGP
jgi:hypothetical protein